MDGGGRLVQTFFFKHKIIASLLICMTVFCVRVAAAAQHHPARAIVVDERLAALRRAPDYSAALVRRLSRGRRVVILGSSQARARDGTEFCRVAVTRRTRGWLPRACLITPDRAGDDERLLALIRERDGYERIAKAKIFLDHYARSAHRATVLRLYADAAETVAAELTREALRRLGIGQDAGVNASAYARLMNYAGLDRYNRQGVIFVYDRAAMCYRYDGAAWREIMRRYPHTSAAAIAARHLAAPVAARRP